MDFDEQFEYNQRHNKTPKIRNIISKSKSKKIKKTLKDYFGKNSNNNNEQDNKIQQENNFPTSVYGYGNYYGFDEGGEEEEDDEDYFSTSHHNNNNNNNNNSFENKSKKKNTEWIADEKIMKGAGCKCNIKRGDTCTCDSFDWFDDLGKFSQTAQRLYTRVPVQNEEFYRQNGFEFCVIHRTYVMSSDSPVINLFGVTEEGNSVFCEVYNFKPYFYIETIEKLSIIQIQQLQRFLVSVCESDHMTSSWISVEKIDGKYTTHGFHDTPIENLYEIQMKYPAGVSKLRKKMIDDKILLRIGISIKRIYESNIDFVIRYTNDVNMGGTGWVNAPFKDCVWDKNRSRCQIEIKLEYNDLIVLKDKEELPPFRILSFDIECVNNQGHFPKPEEDAVFQICATLYDTHTKKRHSIGLTLGDSNQVDGKDVYCFKRERNLMLAWSELIRVCDIDIMTGYNIDKFDNYYLMVRAKSIKIRTKYSQYTRIVRGLNNKDYSYSARVIDKTFESKAYGKKKGKKHTCAGVVNMDLLGILQRDMKLGSYTLNNVSEVILGEKKDDVHHSEIPLLLGRSRDGRTVILEYCFKDADLPLDIILKRRILINLVQLSRVTGSDLDGLVSKGQTHKSKTLMMKHAKLRNMILPTLTQLEKDKQRRDFVGAYVENPLCGYYGKKEDMESIRKYVKRYVQTKIDKILKMNTLKKNIEIPYSLVDELENRKLGEGIGYIKEIEKVRFEDDSDSDSDSDSEDSDLKDNFYEQEKYYITPKTVKNLYGLNDGDFNDIKMKDKIKDIIDKMKIDIKQKFKTRKVNWKGDSPIVCLDFKSLYPTIIIANNICYTTQTDLNTIKKNGWIEGEDYIVTPTPIPHYFVTRKHRIGILPIILKGLLEERDKVKDIIKETKDSVLKSILDGLQLALKVSANSLYGFTGAYFYPNRDIAESVTAFGQVYIKLAKKLVEEKYTIANGNVLDTICVYGGNYLIFYYQLTKRY